MRKKCTHKNIEVIIPMLSGRCLDCGLVHVDTVWYNKKESKRYIERVKKYRNMPKKPKPSEVRIIKENKDVPESYPVKVYCKNCKYSKYYDNEELKFKIDSNYGNWFCSFKDKGVIDCIGNKGIIKDFSTSACKNLNRTFDCKYYKRKWWKFWIKDKNHEGGYFMPENWSEQLQGKT